MINHNPKHGSNKKKSPEPPSLFLNLSAYNRMRRLTSPGSGFQSSDSSARSTPLCDGHEENSGEPKEWTAGVGHGVLITYVSLPGGAGNDLNRVQFRKDLFNTQQAERWWGENLEKIKKWCNVQRIKGKALSAPPEPPSSSSNSTMDEAAAVSASIVEMHEWVEQDEPGVYLTICELADGTRYLLRARFSQRRFGTEEAEMWWKKNRERIQAQHILKNNREKNTRERDRK